MARPVDTSRRLETLANAAEYVLAHGLAGLSLRRLAKALATSPRMLLYDFGSKERLVREILAEIRRRETTLLEEQIHTLDDVWTWIADPKREPFLRLFFETYVQSLTTGEAAPLVTDWLDYLQTRWAPAVDAATATLMVAVVRGLLLDRLATSDHARTDAAFARFSELLM